MGTGALRSRQTCFERRECSTRMAVIITRTSRTIAQGLRERVQWVASVDSEDPSQGGGRMVDGGCPWSTRLSSD